MSWSLSDLGTLGSAIIALLALLRPEISSIFRRFTDNVEIHEAGLIEIGFSNLGPTIALQGTLRAHARSQFVSSMSATIIRQRDNLQHTFEWAAFRSLSLDSSDLQLAAGFLIQQEQPRQYNVVFSDRDTRDILKEPVDELRKLALTFLHERNILLRDLAAAERKAVHEEFGHIQSDSKGAAYSDINRIFYWEPGRYKLIIQVITSKPDKKYHKSFEFNLSKDEASQLRGNVVQLISFASLEDGIIWSWSNVQYLSA